MARISNSFEPGDEIAVAWIESGVCRDAYFTVDALCPDSTDYDLKLSNDSREVYLHEGPMELFGLIEEIQDGSRQGFPALGTGICKHSLAWDIILTILTLDYSAEDALDLAAIGFNWACPEGYAHIRGIPSSDLQVRVDDLIDEFKNHIVSEVA